jgi:hypothetical protein
MAKLRELREEFAARSAMDDGCRCWQGLPKHHRALLLVVTGQPDKLASRAWVEIEAEARQQIGTLARTLANSLSQYARGLR